METDTLSDLDVIGDVHGCDGMLTGLLHRMGYRETDGVWAHHSRRAVFVGDLIDRGPGQREVLRLVRRMRDAGTALVAMGNHEWNAIGWVTRRDDDPAQFLRSRSDSHRHQHRAFLEQVGEGSTLHHELIGWFRELPLWIDLPGLRVVHACWNVSAQMIILEVTGGVNGVTDRLLQEGQRKPPGWRPWDGLRPMSVYDACETTLKGLEIPLPPGVSFIDKDGRQRWAARIQWWLEGVRTFRGATLVEGDAARSLLPEDELPGPFRERDDPDPRPIVFGHYWYRGPMVVQSGRAACVDHSAVLGGRLVAYRWSGEPELSAGNLVAVP